MSYEPTQEADDCRSSLPIDSVYQDSLIEDEISPDPIVDPQIKVYVIYRYSNVDDYDVEIISVFSDKNEAIEKTQELANQDYEKELNDIENDNRKLEEWLDMQQNKQEVREFFEENKKRLRDRNQDPNVYYYRLFGQDPTFEAIGGYNNIFSAIEVSLFD